MILMATFLNKLFLKMPSLSDELLDIQHTKKLLFKLHFIILGNK